MSAEGGQEAEERVNPAIKLTTQPLFSQHKGDESVCQEFYLYFHFYFNKYIKILAQKMHKYVTAEQQRKTSVTNRVSKAK